MSGCCREALPVVQEWSRDPTGCPGTPSGRPVVFDWPSRMSGSGREAFPDVREWSGGPLGCSEVVERPSRISGVAWRPSQNSGSGRQTLPDVRVWTKCAPGSLGGGKRLSGCPGVVQSPYVCPGEFGRPSRMSGSGRETLPDIRSSLEALLKFWEWSIDPPGCPSVDGMPSRMSGIGQ